MRTAVIVAIVVLCCCLLLAFAFKRVRHFEWRTFLYGPDLPPKYSPGAWQLNGGYVIDRRTLARLEEIRIAAMQHDGLLEDMAEQGANLEEIREQADIIDWHLHSLAEECVELLNAKGSVYERKIARSIVYSLQPVERTIIVLVRQRQYTYENLLSEVV